MNSILDGRLVSYQNDLQRSYMILKLQRLDVIVEYQIRMIQENPAGQLLSLHKKQIDDDIYIFFDITSKITLNQFLKRVKVNKHEFLSILKSLIKSIGLGKQYLLQGGSFILHGDYIYIDPASLELSIAYLPIMSEADINQEIKALIMDLLVYKASFEKPSEGDFVYEILSLMKSESFSLNQFDKIIFDIALHQEQGNATKASHEMDFVQNGSEANRAIIKSKAKFNAANAVYKGNAVASQYMIFVLLQLFFVAVAAFLIRYFYFQTEKLDISTLIGISIIIAAMDILLVRRLKLKDKPALAVEKVYKKTEKSKPVSICKKLKNSNKCGARRAANQEFAATQEPRAYIEPKDLETRILLEESPKVAYLMGLSDNVQEKIYIDRPSFVIGRIRSRSDYISPNSAVGKLHAEISNHDGAYYIKDFNSRNGTYINGERIASNVEHSLQNNDRVAFANSEYKFLWSERTN